MLLGWGEGLGDLTVALERVIGGLKVGAKVERLEGPAVGTEGGVLGRKSLGSLGGGKPRQQFGL